jgi:hypothetical protein
MASDRPEHPFRGLKQRAMLGVLLMLAPVPRALAGQSPAPIPAAQIDRRVIAALPAWHGKRARIVDLLDLTRPFHTRGHWTFVAARLAGSHLDATSAEAVDGGPLAECLVQELTPRCKYTMPRRVSSPSWFSIPVHLYAAKVVFAGPGRTEPLLLVKARSVRGGDGSHVIFTTLFAYDRRADRFEAVFANSTGSNNNQETRLVQRGPLRGDVVVAVPTSKAPYAYWIRVYARAEDGRYSVLALRYRSATRYGDRNPLAVIDSEMPNILQRLGRWKPGDPLPIPPVLPSGCAHHLLLRGREEWCAR